MAESSTYKVKPIVFKGRRVPIVCQNVNGPCPLLALANVLLLR
jgi:ubiquitin carboxyl-terminal hydrolase MINDY-1/2